MTLTCITSYNKITFTIWSFYRGSFVLPIAYLVFPSFAISLSSVSILLFVRLAVIWALKNMLLVFNTSFTKSRILEIKYSIGFNYIIRLLSVVELNPLIIEFNWVWLTMLGCGMIFHITLGGVALLGSTTLTLSQT